jgi:hypothetical protein
MQVKLSFFETTMLLEILNFFFVEEVLNLLIDKLIVSCKVLRLQECLSKYQRIDAGISPQVLSPIAYVHKNTDVAAISF